MRSFEYLLLALGVKTSATHTCLELKDGGPFGPYNYKLNSLERTCLDVLGDTSIRPELSSCAWDSLDDDLVSEILKCDFVPTDPTDPIIPVCPEEPLGCSIDENNEPEGDVANGLTCSYKCVQLELGCPEDNNENPISVSGTSIACFDKLFEKWQISVPDTNTTNQIAFTCMEDDCDFIYPDASGEASLSLDLTDPSNPVLINIYTHPAGPQLEPVDVFSCNDDKKNQAGCDCIFDGADKTITSLTCSTSAFDLKCTDLLSCLGVTCYHGKPVIDRIYNDCSKVNDGPGNDGLNYCTRSKEVSFPCGDNYLHNCLKSAGEYECTCDNVPETICDTLNGDHDDQTDPETCKLDKINAVEDIIDCDKICFDQDFKNTTCSDPITFWQCYDGFTYVDIIPATATTHIKAVYKDASYENFTKCRVVECPNGNCICTDDQPLAANEYCKVFPDYYVRKIETITTPAPGAKIDEYEFTCLSFSSDFSAINDINSDLEKESECHELLPPADGENAKCPTIGGCDMTPHGKTGIPAYGFDDCQCDEKCSYECSDSNYVSVFKDGVFPNDWNFEKDGNIYTPYSCVMKEDDKNLVMIICTSIFVPLGVAGIAAGVYFFFFHESSEVAPVETDNELGSTKSSEVNQMQDDNEETHSEIANNN